MIPVRFERGIELPEQKLWLDPWDEKPCAFVSHAHSDHIGTHREVITSPGTALLMRERLRGRRVEHIIEFETPASVRGMEITLLPAGHVFGSAQFFFQNGHGSLLYTGDFKLRAGLSSEKIRWRQADTLIMETTYGLPRYCFPPTDEVIAQMVAFCVEALDDGAVPVLLGYSLGKAQEILCALARAGLRPMLHGAVHRITDIYKQLQPDFPEFEKYAPGATAGKVLICPPNTSGSLMLQKIENRRVAVLTGWAMDPAARFRYQCDAAFPLSDHAGYDDLLRYVELVQPQRVLTLHGHAAEFARDLRARGIEAWALNQQNQLEFMLATPPRISIRSRAAERELKMNSEFRVFAELCEQISATTSKLRKIDLLRDYFRLLNDDQLRIAAIFLTGKPFAQADQRVLQVGWAIISRALLAASGIGEQRLREIASHHADAGKTAAEALADRTSPAPMSLVESQNFFSELQQLRGPIRKTELLQNQLCRLSALESKYLVKILTGELRIGLKEGLVEEAIAAASELPSQDVREASMLAGDLGEVAVRARHRTLDQISLRLFRPVKSMLASPEPGAEAIWQRLSQNHPGPPLAWVEEKFDGIRAQLHRSSDRVEIYSRDLKRVTDQFDEISRSARQLRADVILDGEIVAFEHGRRLTFFDLQKRLGRKTADLFMPDDIPVRFMIFDLLWLNGESPIKSPLQTRRKLLEQIELPQGLELVQVARVQSAEAIESAFATARERGNEGLLVKNADSFYTPGRRGLAWLKLKKELATLDVVVIGAELGHGKRSKVLSDYTFAVRDETTGELLPIGKAYSGLTDEEISALTEHFRANTVSIHGRYRTVKPNVVLEVAFDSIQPSDRHASGLALRFPRIKGIRKDKTVADIDTISEARKIAGLV